MSAAHVTAVAWIGFCTWLQLWTTFGCTVRTRFGSMRCNFMLPSPVLSLPRVLTTILINNLHESQELYDTAISCCTQITGSPDVVVLLRTGGTAWCMRSTLQLSVITKGPRDPAVEQGNGDVGETRRCTGASPYAWSKPFHISTTHRTTLPEEGHRHTGERGGGVKEVDGAERCRGSVPLSLAPALGPLTN